MGAVLSLTRVPDFTPCPSQRVAERASKEERPKGGGRKKRAPAHSKRTFFSTMPVTRHHRDSQWGARSFHREDETATTQSSITTERTTTRGLRRCRHTCAANHRRGAHLNQQTQDGSEQLKVFHDTVRLGGAVQRVRHGQVLGNVQLVIADQHQVVQHAVAGVDNFVLDRKRVRQLERGDASGKPLGAGGFCGSGRLQTVRRTTGARRPKTN